MSAEWEVLRGLFEGVLERPPHERAAFLDEHTKDDAALRRDIESLLAAHESGAAFLSAPAFGSPVGQSDSPRGPHHPASTHTRLATGTSFGVFTIVELLGAGGMGEVYRARDTRLDREVAIKVLSFERDTAPDARQRFEREARAISRLSHPRICTIHDVGVAALDGSDVPFLVMELLDGETLAARMARGPLSVEQAVAYAIDIADALIAAHGQGIVHRDLKPANVMLTSTGVKLLDFGLAQRRKPEPADVSGVPVSSVPGLSSPGLVMGTLPYTSPEQLRGEKVDARTDIFAFGALLYEMLTGTRPFTADSQAGLIAAVLEHDAPPVSDRQPLTPTGLDRIVEKCLAKNPDDRWQTARDLKSELVWVGEGRTDVRRARPSVAGAPGRRAWLQLVAVGIPTLAALALALVLWRATGSVPPRTTVRASLILPPGVTFFIPSNGTSIAIAPDGSRLAFIGVRAGLPSLFIHQFDTGKTAEVADSRNAFTPMFFADSQRVAFGQDIAQERVIKQMPAAGGPVEVVARGAAGPMAWLSDGRFVRGALSNSPIRQIVPAVPGDLTEVSEGEDGHVTPLLMRNGWPLFTSVRGGFRSALTSIHVKKPDTPQASELVADAASPQTLGSDVLVFSRGAALSAAPFDSGAVRLTGEPRAMDVPPVQRANNGAPMYAVANNGTLVYAASPGGRRLVWIDRDGREQFATTTERQYQILSLSPDGTRVAAGGNGPDELWVYGLDGSPDVKLPTSGGGRVAMPVWSPDGSEIFFTTADRIIKRVPADGSTGPQTIFQQPKHDRLHPLSITPDRKHLLMTWDILPRRQGLRLLELGATPKLTPLIEQSGAEGSGRLSRNGKWIVYQSAESTGGLRAGQIMIRPFPNIDAFRKIISTGHGSQPIWSRDGREIFYRTEDGSVMSVAITVTATPPYLRHDPPVRVVSPVNTLNGCQCYDVSPDGRRFLFVKAPELDIRSINIIFNWDVEVKAKLAGTGAATK
jgi:Tol biopolymer transport system component